MMLTISEDDIMCNHLNFGPTDFASIRKREDNFIFMLSLFHNTFKDILLLRGQLFGVKKETVRWI